MKNRKMKNKRALSEMVSYVILIVVALGLAAGVYGWMKIYIPDGEKESCPTDSAISINDYSCDNVSKIISITLKNNGLFSIDGFFIKGSNSSESPIIGLERAEGIPGSLVKGRYDFENSLEPNSIIIANFSYGDVSPLLKVKVQPFVIGEKNILLCENIITEDLSGC